MAQARRHGDQGRGGGVVSILSKEKMVQGVSCEQCGGSGNFLSLMLVMAQGRSDGQKSLGEALWDCKLRCLQRSWASKKTNR